MRLVKTVEGMEPMFVAHFNPGEFLTLGSVDFNNDGCLDEYAVISTAKFVALPQTSQTST